MINGKGEKSVEVTGVNSNNGHYIVGDVIIANWYLVGEKSVKIKMIDDEYKFYTDSLATGESLVQIRLDREDKFYKRCSICDFM